MSEGLAIAVDGLSKEYVVPVREGGLAAALASLGWNRARWWAFWVRTERARRPV